MRSFRAPIVSFAVLAALGACSPPAMNGAACEPGARAACECPGGSISSETCGSDGRYLPCECAMPDAAIAMDASDATPRADGATDSGSHDDARALDASVDAARDASTDARGDAATDGCVRARCTSAHCGLVDDGCGGSLACACIVPDVRPGRLVWDAPRGLAYVTVRQESTQYANTVVAFDPMASSVYWAVPVGADPFPIALADDGRTVWTGLIGANAIRRFDATTFAVEPPQTLPRGAYGSVSAPIELEPIPTMPTSVFVSMEQNGWLVSSSGRAPAEVVMDDGIPRGGVVATSEGHSVTSGPPGFVYGFDNVSTGFGFVVMEIGPRGLITSTRSGLVSEFETTIRYGAGRVFGSDGSVIDVATDPRMPRVATRIPAGFVYIEPESNHGYLLTLMPCTLSRFALDTYAFDQRVDCGGFRNRTIADLTRVAPGRYVAVGLADMYAPIPTLYTLDAPF